MEHTCQI